MLRGIALGVIGLVVEAAGRCGRVVGKAPAVGQHAVVERAGRPEVVVLDRVLVQPAGERLVEVAAGDDVVALGIFLLEERLERGGLRGLALAVVIRLQMEVDEHELHVRAFEINIYRHQAALEVGNRYRPLERARQGDALGRGDRCARERHDSGTHLADRRDGVGHKIAFVVAGVRGVASGLCAHAFSLFDAVGAGRGVGLDLLQEREVGVEIFHGADDAVHVLFHDSLARRTHLLAAVHEEIGLFAQSGVADVPRQDGHAVARGKAGDAVLAVGHDGGFGLDIQLRGGQPDEQRGDQADNDGQNDQNDLERFFHGTVPSSGAVYHNLPHHANTILTCFLPKPYRLSSQMPRFR